jgi:Uma2 family endonuclease
MTAQPIPAATRRAWTPDPVRQRLADHTIEDVLALPDDAPRVELRDGVMIVAPSPTIDHQDIAFLLWRWFRQNAPREFKATGGVGVVVSFGDTLEPDVVLVRAPVPGDHHYLLPEQVVIAVEVVSPGTKRRDRLEKPADYAAAGVPFFWRVEQNPVHVYAYELGADGAYKLTADSGSELVLERPFGIRLSIADISP